MVGAQRSDRTIERFLDDLDVLNFLLSLEHMQHELYRLGLATFGAADFDLAQRPESERLVLREIRDQEALHVAELSRVTTRLGGVPVEAGSYDFTFEDVEAFLTVAATVENTVAAAYAEAARWILDAMALYDTLTVLTVEARHAAYLNFLLGESPFPDAFDEPLERSRVLESLAAFIVS